MYRVDLTELTSLWTLRSPMLAIEEHKNDPLVINLWRSRKLSTKYNGNFSDFIIAKISGLLKNGFERVVIDCGRQGKKLFGKNVTYRQEAKDADFFLSPTVLNEISNRVKKNIIAKKDLRPIKDYDGIGQHIVLVIELEKSQPGI